MGQTVGEGFESDFVPLESICYEPFMNAEKQESHPCTQTRDSRSFGCDVMCLQDPLSTPVKWVEAVERNIYIV